MNRTWLCRIPVLAAAALLSAGCLAAGPAAPGAGHPNPPRNHPMSAAFIAWPAPAGEPPSPDYTLDVNGSPVFVYAAPVRAEIVQNKGLWSHQFHGPAQRAAFAIFDVATRVTVTVRPARPFTTAQVLPARAGITPEVTPGQVRFTLEQPRHLTLLLDGSDEVPLHLFIGEPETNVPDPQDPNVVYFGPGVHQLEALDVKSGQTVYLAGGAIVKAVLRPGEEGKYSEKWKVTFYSGHVLNVNHVKGVRISGRGILDGGEVPHPGRNLVAIMGAHDVQLGGIVLRDSPNWNVIIQGSEDVRVDDLRIVSGRLNSDGINSVGSRNVRIRRCFVRNHDDSIVVKTTQPNQPAADIQVEDCTLWSDWGYSLGATYETRSPISNVAFRRCNILFSRHWCLGVHVSDSATVSGLSFSDVEIADLGAAAHLGGAHAALTPEPRLLRLAVTQDVWGHDPERGHVRDISLDNVTIHGPRMLPSELLGADAAHGIENVRFRNVHLAGQPPVTDAAGLRLRTNDFVHGVVIEAP